MSQIETPGVLNGYLVFPEQVMMNIYKVKLKGLIVTQ
jgi:hypothetical protein